MTSNPRTPALVVRIKRNTLSIIGEEFFDAYAKKLRRYGFSETMFRVFVHAYLKLRGVLI